MLFSLTTSDITKLKKELARFLVVGCSAVATDFLIYFTLLNILQHAPAKTISFIAGTIVAYIFNKYWTFEKPEQNHVEMFHFFTLYATTLGANVTINQLSLHIFPNYILLAFLAATGTSTILNFIGQKWWVFK